MAVILTAFAGVVFWSGSKLYAFGVAIYAKYQAFRDSIETKHTLLGRLADKRFENYTNVLLLGIDDGNLQEPDSARNADAVLIASIRNDDGSVRLLSVPGETIVSIPGRQTIDNVNRSYFYGEMQLTIRTIEESLYLPIHHYVVADIRAFDEFIDILGGVDLYVEEDMDYEDAYAGFAIHLKKGYQHLDGRAAEQYVRYRGDELGVIGRVQRQQRLIKALNEKLTQTDIVSKMPQLIELIQERTIMSLAPLDALKLLKNLYGLHTDKITVEMLPGEFVTVNNRQHWQINEGEKQALLDAYFPETSEK